MYGLASPSFSLNNSVGAAGTSSAGNQALGFVNLLNGSSHHHHHAGCPAMPGGVIMHSQTLPFGNALPLPLAAAPLPSSPCVFCNAEVAESLSHATIQVPVPVQVNLSTGLPSTELNTMMMPQQTIRLLGENELLQPQPPPAAGYYLLPPIITSHGSKKRPEEGQKFKNKNGLDHWYLKRRQSQIAAAVTSNRKIVRVQKTLKRLQNHWSKRQWKMEKRANYEESELIRESKLQILRRKGIKAPEKTECTLWNCPRKEFQRKRSSFASHARLRSVSRLSNLSARSRSPITFSKSP